MAISPQGTTLASRGKTARVRPFRLVPGWTGRCHRPMATMDTNGFCVAFAPDGRSLAATGIEYRARPSLRHHDRENASRAGGTDDCERIHPGVRSRWPHPRRGRRPQAPFGSGTSRRDPVRSRSSDIRIESGAWRSHPTAARWRPPAVTARSGSGMRGVDRTGPSSAGWRGSRCIRITDHLRARWRSRLTARSSSPRTTAGCVLACDLRDGTTSDAENGRSAGARNARPARAGWQRARGESS